MQTFFKDITAGDLEAVRRRVTTSPGAVALVATAPPKSYAGQSPLMVALRTGQFAIASLLLDHGADVNFRDDADPSTYARPVLHDAIKAAVLRSRRQRPAQPSDDAGVVQRRNDNADDSFALVRRMLESGADLHALDNHGNTALHRAVMDAAQMLPRRNDPDPAPLAPLFVADLTRIFDLLLTHGADPHRTEKQLGRSLIEFYGDEPVGRFLRTT